MSFSNVLYTFLKLIYMILIKDFDCVVTIAASVADMETPPTTIKLTALQSKTVTIHNVHDVHTNERTAIYKFYVVRESTPTEAADVTYLQLENGTYNYELGSETGLFQIGIPTLEKTTYNGNGGTNDVYYNS